VGEPYQGSYVSLVLPATLPDGTAAVLKLQYPDPDSTHEAAALRVWDCNGAVGLLEHDERWLALLLERCEAGSTFGRALTPTPLPAFVRTDPGNRQNPVTTHSL